MWPLLLRPQTQTTTIARKQRRAAGSPATQLQHRAHAVGLCHRQQPAPTVATDGMGPGAALEQRRQK